MNLFCIVASALIALTSIASLTSVVCPEGFIGLNCTINKTDQQTHIVAEPKIQSHLLIDPRMYGILTDAPTNETFILDYTFKTRNGEPLQFQVLSLGADCSKVISIMVNNVTTPCPSVFQQKLYPQGLVQIQFEFRNTKDTYNVNVAYKMA